MINFNILSVGNLKEKYLIDFKNEYIKRIGKFAKIKEIVLPDEPLKNDVETLKKIEGDRILEAIPKNSYVILLALEGTSLSSEEFSAKIDEIATYHNANITFIIGGSYGVDDEVKSRSNYKISFSKMTFPHQVAKCLLVEQLYRALTILNNVTYHK